MLKTDLIKYLLHDYSIYNMSVKDISKKYNVSVDYVYKELKYSNLTKSASECKIKYKIIYPDFFKEVKSEEQAYFLGLMYADGWTDSKNNQIAISLQEKDKEILDIFNNLIYENKPLRFIKSNLLQQRTSNQYRFVITNKSMYEDSVKLGLMPNKTFKLVFPNFINDNLLSHFIRGYFDGDGCVGAYKRKKSNGENRTTQIFNLIGTKSFLDGISNHFHKVLGLRKPNIVVKHKNRPNPIFTLSYSSKNDVIIIGQYLYHNSNYFLKRKKQIFNLIV